MVHRFVSEANIFRTKLDQLCLAGFGHFHGVGRGLLFAGWGGAGRASLDCTHFLKNRVANKRWEGAEMANNNFPRCEFKARAKDYHGWSNAEQPLVQGLAKARGGSGQPLI